MTDKKKPTLEEIERRIREGKAKAEALRRGRAQLREHLIAGRDHIAALEQKELVQIMSWQVGPYHVAAAAVFTNEYRQRRGEKMQSYWVTYAVCSRKDTFSERQARGYLGHRLLKGHRWNQEIHIPRYTAKYPGVVLTIAQALFNSHILACDEVPRALSRELAEDIAKRMQEQ